MTIMTKDEVKQWAQETTDALNELLKGMSDEEAQAFLDGMSESFFHLGDNRKEH